MSVENVLALIQENEVKFVDLRFTDTKGKEQHISIPHIKLTLTSSKKAKCLMALHRRLERHQRIRHGTDARRITTAVLDPFTEEAH